MKDTSEALVHYGNALFDPVSSSIASISISNIYLGKNQFEPALHILQNALNVFPASTSGWSKLGELYLKLGKQSEAIECEKISAKLGNAIARNRLKYNFIPYDSVDLRRLPWLSANPFEEKWNTHTLYDSRLIPPDYVPVDRPPIPIKQVQPKYPDVARRAGVNGTVWVKCLISKRGRVTRVLIMQSDSEILNQPAIDAAIQWEFSPALINGEPVVVWAAVPFRFRIN